MKTKNHLSLFLLGFLISTTALFSQSENGDNPEATSPLMMFRRGEKHSGEEKKEHDVSSLTAEQRGRTVVDDPSSGVVRGTVFRGEGGEASDPDLAAAQKAKQDSIAQKANAINEVHKSNSALDPAKKIAKAQEEKASFKNQAAGFLEAVSTADSAEAARLTQIAHTYLAAAEEAEQVEHLWTLRQQKNAIPWANRTERGQAQIAIEEASKFAALDPTERREKILATLLDGLLNHYQHADTALREAQEAWDHQAASRWAVENQQVALEQVALVLKEKKAEFDAINLEKTRAGRIAAIADKITDVVQYVSINNVSPAVFTKGIAIVADVMNRRNAKAPLKAAARTLDDHAQIADELNAIAASAAQDAPEKESSARRAESEARQAEENVAIVAAKKLKPFFDGADLWKKEMEQAQRAVHQLQQEEHSNLEVQGRAAREARSIAIAHQDQVKQLQRDRTQQELNRETAQNALNNLQDQDRDWKADGEAADKRLGELRMAERNKQQEVTSFNDVIHEIDQLLTEAQSMSSSANQEATALEKKYREQHKEAFDRDAAIGRNISRAQAHAIAHQAAYLAHWPKEAMCDGITAESIVAAKVSMGAATAVSNEPITSNPVAAEVAEPISVKNESDDSAMSQDARTAEALDLQLLAKIAQKMKRQLAVAHQSFQDEKKSLEIKLEDQLTEEEKDGLIGDISKATEEVATATLLERVIQEQEEKTAKVLAAYYQYSSELENNFTGEVAAKGDAEGQSDANVIKEDLIDNIRDAYIGIQRVYFYFQKCSEAEAMEKQKKGHEEQYQKNLGGMAALIKNRKK